MMNKKKKIAFTLLMSGMILCTACAGKTETGIGCGDTGKGRQKTGRIYGSGQRALFDLRGLRYPNFS